MELRNKEDVLVFLAPKIEIIVNHILDEIGKLNEDTIQKIVYDVVTPHYYKRTNDGENFKSAWGTLGITTNTTKGTTTGVFGYKPEVLSYNPFRFQHGSIYNSQGEGIVTDSRPYLADIIYNGISEGSGSLFGYGDWSEPRDAWTELLRIVTVSKMRKWIKEGAKEAGLKIKF